MRDSRPFDTGRISSAGTRTHTHISPVIDGDNSGNGLNSQARRAISGHRSERPGEPVYVRVGGNVSLLSGTRAVSGKRAKYHTRSAGALSLLGTLNYLLPLSLPLPSLPSFTQSVYVCLPLFCSRRLMFLLVDVPSIFHRWHNLLQRPRPCEHGR